MSNTKAYQEILAVLEKHGNIVDKDYKIDIRATLRDRIKVEDLSSLFGFTLPNEYNNGYIRLSNYESINFMGAANNRTISWSDDGRQPEDEYLYVIRFPSGAYALGDHYPTHIFQEFWGKLLGFKPKYSDTNNHALYFSPENAIFMREAFSRLFEQYVKIGREEYKAIEIKDLEDRLSDLKRDAT